MKEINRMLLPPAWSVSRKWVMVVGKGGRMQRDDDGRS